MRYYWAFVLACIIAACGCGRHIVSGIEVNSAFRPLVMPDTKALVGVDVGKLKTTPLYQRHEKDLNFPLLNGTSERIGFDPRRDISRVLIEWNGKQALVMAEGTFSPSEIENKARRFGAQQTAYKKYTLVGDAAHSVVFFGKKVGVEGSPDALRAVIDLQDRGAGAVPEALQERLHAIPKQDQIWEASREGLPFTELPMRSEVSSALSNVVSYISGTDAGIAVDSGIHVEVNLTCISDQGAKRVHDALRGAIGFGRLSTRDDQQDLLRVYDAIDVTQDKQLVRVRADYSADLADKLLGYVSSTKLRSVR